MGASEAEYMADMAWRHGKSSGELYGRERIRMEDIKRRRDPWHTVPKLYNGVCYVFTDTRVLCTAYLWNEEDGFAPQPRRMGPFYSGGNAFCRR